MFNWGIRNKVLLLSLLPSIGISVLLGSYLSYTRIAELEEFIDERGSATSQQLAVILQYATQANDLKLLQPIASATLEEKGVRSVSLFNKDKIAQIHAGPRMKNPLNTDNPALQDKLIKTYTEDTIQFSSPIRANNLISDNNFNNTLQADDNIIGWVTVEYSSNVFTIKIYQTLFASTVLILLTLVITGIFTLRVSNQVISSIQLLISRIRQLKNGDLKGQINIPQGGELANLANEINQMTASIKSSFDEMQSNVEQTTGDLRETLETIEIQNIELDLARKEAIEASRIKSEFLANTSHEIRTPLNGIIGFTNLLLKMEMSSQQRDYLETIQQSSDGLLTIINDILDFSKIEAGKLVLDHVAINLRRLIEETLTMLAPTANEKGLELILLIYSDVPVDLIGDPLRIKQVITNLVSNAIKFTEQGNIIIRVNLEDQKDDHVHLTISITDSGIGLSPRQQQDIFSAFTQADTSTSREFGGTGLGLVISKRLVEQMGGDIGLESELGKGSTFKFSIKAKLAETMNETGNNILQGKHVVLYESNPVLQLSLKHMLESWKVKVHCLENDNEIPIEHLKKIAKRTSIDIAIAGVSHQQLSNNPCGNATLLSTYFNKPTILLSPGTTLLSEIRNNRNLHLLAKPAPGSKLNKLLINLCTQPISETIKLPASNNHIYTPASLTERPTKILAVDDNAANLKLLTVLLNDMGVDVTQASSGSEALEKVQIHNFDLIFMDIQMPEMDGITTTQHIRALDSDTANIPIIALTAHAMAEERQKLLKAGLNDHLTKPINEGQLFQVIQRWCQDSKTDSSKPEPPFNLQLSLQLSNQKPDLAHDMLIMLVNKLEEDKSDIAQAYTEGKLELLLERVHKLHGATCYAGVPHLKVTSKMLETALKTRNTPKINMCFNQLMEAIDKLLAWTESHDLDLLFFPEKYELSEK